MAVKSKLVSNLKKIKKPDNLVDRLVPVLLLASIGLSFMVGMLYERVNNLQNGGTKVAATPPTANSGTEGQPTAGKLGDLVALAKASGVNEGKFSSCFDAGKYKDRVQKDLDAGAKAGVQGTPGNFVVNSKNEVWFVPGAYPYEMLKPVVEIALGNSSDALPQGIEKLSADMAKNLPALDSSDHVQGNRNASIKLITYTDFECPYCQQFHSTAVQIKEEYGNNLVWAYRHFPLESIHPQARPAAEASECIYELGGDDAFWKFAETVFGK